MLTEDAKRSKEAADEKTGQAPKKAAKKAPAKNQKAADAAE